MIYKLFISLSVLFSLTAVAETSLLQNTSVAIGMANISLSENESTLESEDGDSSEVSDVNAISSISIELTYQFKQYLNKSIFLKSYIPMLSSDGSGYYMGGVGVNFYLNSISSIFNFNDEGTSLRISPTFRYYVGGFIGGGYLIYTTETAKKSDVVLDLSAQAGVDYKVSPTWSISAELSAGRLTGVNTTGFGITAFFGGTYFLP